MTSLQTQLEESSRWNASLQARLSQQSLGQQRGGGVGGANDADTSVAPSRDCSMLQDSFGFPMHSFIPSFRQLPDADALIPNEGQLQNMTPAELRQVIEMLRDELQTANACSDSLQAQLNAMAGIRDIPGENNQDRKSLTPRKQKVAETEQDLAKLRAQLKHTEYLNDLLKHQIRLNTQSANTPAGFNPELIVQMAQEIERLKEELEKMRDKLNKTDTRDSLPPRGSAAQSPLLGSSKNSADAQVALQKQMESLRTESNDAKVRLLKSLCILHCETSSDVKFRY